ncbi:MAG: hypothetical protein JKY68_02615 [Rhodospirillales bacterium]|nr:hypothetical protein [Rhodospirillales bacterium]
MDPDDTLSTKTALRDLGHFRTPKYGLTPYPDQPMLEGIKSFQRQNGLLEDGVMKPDGPTVTVLGQVLDQRRPKRSSQKTDNLLDRLPGPQGGQGLALASKPIPSLLRDSIGQPLPPRPGAEPPIRKPKTGTQVAAGPAAALLLPLLSTAGRAALQRAAQSLLGGAATATVGSLKGDTPSAKKTVPNSRPRTDIAPPLPPTPGFEPPDDNDRPPAKTESPAEPPKLPTLKGRPINEVMRNDPLIFQEISEELRKEFNRPLESHPGNQVTQDWNKRVANDIFNDAIRLWGPEKKKEFDHTGGASDADGERKPEDYLPNKDVPIGQDGRKGSSNPDITHTHLPTDKKIYTNTGRTLKDGRTGVAHERRSYKVLLKNAVENLAIFLPKYRPGMDEDAMAKIAKKIYVEELTKLWGPPPK